MLYNILTTRKTVKQISFVCIFSFTTIFQLGYGIFVSRFIASASQSARVYSLSFSPSLRRSLVSLCGVGRVS